MIMRLRVSMPDGWLAVMMALATVVIVAMVVMALRAMVIVPIVLGTMPIILRLMDSLDHDLGVQDEHRAGRYNTCGCGIGRNGQHQQTCSHAEYSG